MIKVEFRQYPDGTWTDWTDYLSTNPSVSQKIESDKDGEAGVIAYDGARLSFYSVSGNPVHTAFNINLTSVQRYLFRISFLKTDKSPVSRFVGMVDFSSIERPELSNEINFEVKDKLSALSILENIPQRGNAQSSWTRLQTQIGDATTKLAYYEWVENATATAPYGKIMLIRTWRGYGSPQSTYFMEHSEPIIKVGEVLQDPNPSKNESYLVVDAGLIKASEDFLVASSASNVGATNGTTNTTWVKVIPEGLESYGNFNNPGQNIDYYGKEYFGVDDILITQYAPYDPFKLIAKAFDGIKIIQAIVSQQWNNTTVITRGITEFEIPLEYQEQLIGTNPFNGNPLDALKELSNSMNCYVFFDNFENLIIQKKTTLGTGGVRRSIGNTRIIDMTKKDFWDKLADGAKVDIKSSIREGNVYLTGSYTLTKSINGSPIKPKNLVSKTLYSVDSNNDTVELLNNEAALGANEVLDFYGKRHDFIKLTLDLDDNTIDWSIADNIVIDSKEYFFSSLDLESGEDTIDLSLVSVTGYDYDLRQVVFYESENSQSSSSNYIQSSSGSGTGLGYIFNPPLSLLGTIVQLKHSDNFKVVGTTLDLAQDIKTISTPQFEGLGIGGAYDTNFKSRTYGNAKIDGDLTIDGDIYIGGNVNQVNQVELNVEDKVIRLNKGGTTTTAQDAGVIIEGDNGSVAGQIKFNSNSWIFEDITSLKVKSTNGAWFYNVENVEQTNIMLGKFTTSESPLFLIKTNDATDDSITFHSNRWAGNSLFTRSSATGLKYILELRGSPSSSRLSLYDGDTQALTVNFVTNTAASYLINSKFGLGCSDPQRNFEIRKGDGSPQFRLGYSSTKYVDLYTSSNGELITYVDNDEKMRIASDFLGVRYNGSEVVRINKDGLMIGTNYNYGKLSLFDFHSYDSGSKHSAYFLTRWDNNTSTSIRGTTLLSVAQLYTQQKLIAADNDIAVMQASWLFSSTNTTGADNLISLKVGKHTTQGSGDIDNLYEIYVEGARDYSSGQRRIGNWYALYIKPGTVGVDNSFGVYQTNYNLRNAFHGHTSIGCEPSTDTRFRVCTQPTDSTAFRLMAKPNSQVLMRITETTTWKNKDFKVDSLANLYSLDCKIGLGTSNLTESLNIKGNVKFEENTSLFNNFTSGWTGSGFRLDYGVTNPNTSTLELNDLFVRGTMSVYELLIQQIRATNGSQFISSSAKVVSIHNDPPFYIKLRLEDPSGHGIAPFLVNDIVVVQRVRLDSTTIVKRLIRKVYSVSGIEITLVALPDAPSDTGTFEKGDTVVRLGNTINTARQGVIYLTSDDSNAPYIDVIDEVNSWSTWTSKDKLKVRLGKLTGITDATFGTLDGYGLYTSRAFLSSNTNTGIQLKVENDSALFEMKQNGNSIFDFNTSTATAHLAGWTITHEKIYKQEASYKWTTLHKDGYIYTGYGYEPYNSDIGVTLGIIPSGQPNAGQVGIQARNNLNGVTYFVLTDFLRKISGWEFDYNKLFNSTNIVLDGTNKRISVNNNSVQMYHVSSSDYGIKDSSGRFQLGSTNKIGGWEFDANFMWNGDKQTTNGYSKSGITLRGNGALYAPQFYLSTDGNAYFKGALQAATGTFAGALEAATGNFVGSISIGAGTSIFKADSNGIYLGSSTFATAPFRVSPVGAAVMNNVQLQSGASGKRIKIESTKMMWYADSTNFLETEGFVSTNTAGIRLGTPFNPLSGSRYGVISPTHIILRDSNSNGNEIFMDTRGTYVAVTIGTNGIYKVLELRGDGLYTNGIKRLTW